MASEKEPDLTLSLRCGSANDETRMEICPNSDKNGSSNENTDPNASSCPRSNKRKREPVPAPFLWATDQRATVHTQQYLLEHNIRTIKGKVYCKKCQKEFELGLNLEEKLANLRNLISNKVHIWHNRAPPEWLNPVYPKCTVCGPQCSTRPIIAEKKKEINWLFLLLGQMLGCCTLDHLKYFCKHNDIHRTGAKDRLLYLTYINLVKQLLPNFSVD